MTAVMELLALDLSDCPLFTDCAFCCACIFPCEQYSFLYLNELPAIACKRPACSLLNQRNTRVRVLEQVDSITGMLVDTEDELERCNATRITHPQPLRKVRRLNTNDSPASSASECTQLAYEFHNMTSIGDAEEAARSARKRWLACSRRKSGTLHVNEDQ